MKITFHKICTRNKKIQFEIYKWKAVDVGYLITLRLGNKSYCINISFKKEN